MVFSTKIKVKQGIVIGGEDLLPNGNPYHYFQGIPYAVPPLGELRFKAPVPLEKFSVPELECIREGENSLQVDKVTDKISIGSEDCLYLNVFVPKSESDTPLPVMVYIHGGGFETGSGNTDRHNPLYLLQEGVIIITSNYRLGSLGFLSFPEAGVPGNAGLKDQQLVMKWVKENVSQFNGDPSNITLFGHSSGGMSVHFHLLSESSRKLFNKVIMQSGAATMPGMFTKDGSSQTKMLAKALGYPSDDPHLILKFLQQHENLDDFIKPPNVDSILIKPVVEGDSPEAIITKPFIESMKDKFLVEIPAIIGYTSTESLSSLPDYGENLEEFDNDFRQFVPVDNNTESKDPKILELANSIKEFYFKGKKVDKNTLYSFCDLLSDYKFVSHIHQAADMFAKFNPDSPLYFYRFDYDGQLNLYKIKYKVTHLKGANHVDELCYVFKMAASPPEPWEPEAMKMVLTICRMWANFAKYSNPTPKIDGELVRCIWEPVDKVTGEDIVTKKALIFDKDLKIMENPNGERVAFWKNLMRECMKISGTNVHI